MGWFSNLFHPGRKYKKRLKRQYEENLYKLNQEEKKIDMVEEELNLYSRQFNNQYNMAWRQYDLQQQQYSLEKVIYETDFQREVEQAQAIANMAYGQNNSAVSALTTRMALANITSKVLKQQMIYDFNRKAQNMKYNHYANNLEMLYERTKMQISHEAQRVQMARDEIGRTRQKLKRDYEEAREEINSHFSGFGGFLNSIAIPALGAIAGFGLGGIAAKGLGLATGSLGAIALGSAGAIAGGLGTWQRLNGALPGGLSTLNTLASTLPGFANLFSSLPNLSTVLQSATDTNNSALLPTNQSGTSLNSGRSLSAFERLQRSNLLSSRDTPGLLQGMNYGGSDVLGNMFSNNNKQLQGNETNIAVQLIK